MESRAQVREGRKIVMQGNVCTAPAARSTFFKCALTSTGPKTWDGRNQSIANAVVVMVDNDVGRELWRHSSSGGGRRRRRDVFEVRRR